MSDIFISYSQKDSEAVNLLIQALRIAAQENSPQEAIDIWIDKTDIPYSADLWDRIQLGIREARSVLVAWSENYLASEITNEELAFALSLGKPIIPVYISPVTEEGYRKKIQERQANDGHWQRQPTTLAEVHHALLRKRLYISYNPDALDETARQILTAAAQNLPYKDGLRKWSNRAYEWTLHEQSPRYLLSGADLEDAEAWRDNAAEEQLAIDRGLIDFIAQSRFHQQRRQRRFVIGAGTALFVMAVLLVLVIVLLRDTQANLNTANINATRAVANVNALSTVVARTNTTTAETNLPFEALDLLASSDNDDTVALLRAAHALRYEPYDPAMDRALQGLIGRVYTYQDYELREPIFGGGSQNLVYLPTQERHLVVSGLTAMELIDTTDMTTLWRIEGDGGNTVIPDQIAVDSQGSYIAGVKINPVGSVTLVDAANGEILEEVESAGVSDIVFSDATQQWITVGCIIPNSPYASCSVENSQGFSELTIWNQNPLTINTTFIYNENFASLAVSPDGKYAAVSEYNNPSIFLIDLATGQQIRYIRGHASYIQDLVFSPDSRLLASTSADRTINLWNIDENALYRSFQMDALVSELVFSPDGLTLASVDTLGSAITLWDIFTGEKTILLHDEALYVGILTSAALALDPSGERIASAACIESVPDQSYQCAFIGLREWTIPNGTNRYRWQTNFGYYGVTALTLFDDNQYAFAAGCYRGVGNMCETGQMVRFALSDGAQSTPIYVDGLPTVFAVTKDGQRVLSGSQDGQIVLIDLESNAPPQTYPEAPIDFRYPHSAVFAPDERTALFRLGRYSALLDLNTGEWIIPTIETAVGEVVYTPDGSAAIIADQEGNLHWWDIATQQVNRTVSTGRSQGVFYLRFSSDARWLAVVADINEVQLYNAQTLEMITQIPATNTSYFQFGVQNDNLWLVDGNDGLIQHWSFGEDRSPQLLSERHLWFSNRLRTNTWQISSDEQYVLVGDETGAIYVWDTDYRVFLDDVCSRIGRDFTPEERTLYGIDDRPTCPSS